ncbi:MAG: hypothetical protein ABIF28_09335 [Pseudomonadota bacterium]
MEQTTIVAIVGLVASLLGTTVGGLISHVAAKSARRDEWRSKQRDKHSEQRQATYSEFLLAIGQPSMDAFQKKLTDETMSVALAQLLPIAARCRLLSTEVGDEAIKVINWIVTNSGSNRQSVSEPFTAVCNRFTDAARSDIEKAMTGT